MKKYFFLFVITITLFISGCSTKEVFEPKKLDKDWDQYEASKYRIIDTTSNVALLKDRKVLTSQGVVDVNVSQTKRVVSQSDSWIITTSIDGNLTLTSQNDPSVAKNLHLKKTIASASVDGNNLAVVFADNEIALYDIPSQDLLFREQESKYIAVDSRIVTPLFMRGLVLFPTLDGKVVFVNLELKKKLRTVIVSSEDHFNNIISLDILENKIIAATSYKVLSMAKKQIRAKYEIRDIVYGEHMIYLATKQGEIISLTSSLQVISKVKFPFAHFYGMKLNKGKLYILEQEGYMIVLDAKTFDYSVYPLRLNYNIVHSDVYSDFMKNNNITNAMKSIDIEDSFIFKGKKGFYLDKIKILTP